MIGEIIIVTLLAIFIIVMILTMASVFLDGTETWDEIDAIIAERIRRRRSRRTSDERKETDGSDSMLSMRGKN